MESVPDLLIELCVMSDTRLTADHFTNLESFSSLNAAPPLKAEPLSCCSLGHLLCRPEGHAQIPAHLCVLASSIADPHSWGPPEFACFGKSTPNFGGMRLPGMCKALCFVRGHRNTPVRLLLRMEQSENLPVPQLIRDLSDSLGHRRPPAPHTLTASWHYLLTWVTSWLT